jgi:hypothetical protein
MLAVSRCRIFCISVFYTDLQFFLLLLQLRVTIFPVVLYGCETWSLTSREKRGLRVFENRVI